MEHDEQSRTAQRLTQLRKEAGFSNAAEFARTHGFNEGTQRSYENGNRAISRTAAVKLALALKSTPGYILYGDNAAEQLSEGLEHIPIGKHVVPLVGNVQAGAFIEAFEEIPTDFYPAVGAMETKANVFCLRVIGDSMNKIYPEGSILYCQKLDDYLPDLKNGKRVVVKRRAAGDLFEATVKQYSCKGNIATLTPLSNNAKYKTLTIKNNGEHHHGAGSPDIEIWAVVVGSYIEEN